MTDKDNSETPDNGRHEKDFSNVMKNIEKKSNEDQDIVRDIGSLSKYYVKPVFGTSNLLDSCFLDDMNMSPFLIPNRKRGEDMSTIIDRFKDTNSEICSRMSSDSFRSNAYLTDYGNDMLSSMAPGRKTTITRNISLESGGIQLVNNYQINGRTVGALLDSLYTERLRILGWLKYGGLDTFDYKDAVRGPVDRLIRGMDYHRITSGKSRSRVIYPSTVLGTLVGKFTDAFTDDVISVTEVHHLFAISAYISYDDADEKIKVPGEDVIYHFLLNLEQMDSNLKIMRKNGELSKV